MRGMKRCFLIICALFLLCGCQTAESTSPVMEMICLDVGQGSSTLLRTSEGDILIDAGGEEMQDELCGKLRALGVTRLSVLILTHPDEDHIGGADRVLETFGADAVWVNGDVAENESYERFVRMVGDRSVPVKTVRGGDGIALGALQLSVLSPLEGLSGDANADSLVLLIRCASFGALIMGDAGERVEESLVAAYGKAHLDVDVLCVGHHGAENASGQRLLEATTPRYAVVSCGAANPHGHPDGRVLSRLENTGAEILRTDRAGDVTVSVFADTYEINSQKNDEWR